jgi:CubicO group peptidase (beta-lactamase class C family)
VVPDLPARPERPWEREIRPERPGVMYAVGVDGQVITVDPAHDLTFVQLATEGGSDVSLAVSEAILDAFAAADS